MSSRVPLFLEYAYVLLWEKMDMQHNSLISSPIFCRYGDLKDVLPIGGLVDIGETPIATDSRYYRQVINFVLEQHDHL